MSSIVRRLPTIFSQYDVIGGDQAKERPQLTASASVRVRSTQFDIIVCPHVLPARIYKQRTVQRILLS